MTQKTKSTKRTKKTKTFKTPRTKESKSIRLSFRLPVSETPKDSNKPKMITTSISLKDKIIAFWFLTGSKKEFFQEDRTNQLNWKKPLYEFLTPLLKEIYLEHHSDPNCSLSSVAFNLLLEDSLKTLGFSKKDSLKFNQISDLISGSVTEPNLVLDIAKKSKKVPKVKKVKKVKVKKKRA